jgi:hypothetical protein
VFESALDCCQSSGVLLGEAPSHTQVGTEREVFLLAVETAAVVVVLSAFADILR